MDTEDDLDAQIEEQVGEWSTDSNDCFHISLIRSDGKEHATFQPKFTYPIFGEQEAIFGYQGLSIDLTFSAHTLEPRLHISYDQAYKEQGDIRPTDIKAAIKDFLTEEAFLDTRISQDSGYIPPSEVIRTYSRGSGSFEVRCASLADPAARKMLERMQVLVPLFIEGGSILQLEQDWTAQRWKLFTLWSVDAAKADYSLVGYGTSYQIFTLPERGAASADAMSLDAADVPDFPPFSRRTPTLQSPLELLSRERLSQFLILPDFQRSGHGQELYRAMFSYLTKADNVREFTVEDPNEEFDEMRDFCDLTWLRGKYPEFAALEINADISSDLLVASKEVPTDAIVSKDVKERIRRESKIIDRQFDRMVEMHTLSRIPRPNRSRARLAQRERSSNVNDRKYYFWRMLVKQRAMIFNHDALIQLDPSERAEKLEAVVDSNQEQYVDVIERVLKKESEGLDLDGDGNMHSNGTAKVAKKRRIVEDDDEDDDEDEEERGSVAAKKPKLA